MNKYWVTIPITGKLVVQVEAESKENAIELAFNKADLEDLEEWETHTEVCKGNVFYGVCSRVDVEEDR